MRTLPYSLYCFCLFADAGRNLVFLKRGFFERSGVFLVITSMDYEWTNYNERKPEKEGTYLLVYDDASYGIPRCGDVAKYHPIHGWSGAAHTLEKSIICWMPFPWPDLRSSSPSSTKTQSPRTWSAHGFVAALQCLWSNFIKSVEDISLTQTQNTNLRVSALTSLKSI